MKKLTSLLIVGLCLAVSGLADVVDKPQAKQGKTFEKQPLKRPPLLRKPPTLKPSPLLRKAPPVRVNKASKRPPLLRKAPPTLKPSPLLRKAVPPRNERGGNHNSSRSNTSRRAPQKGANPDNGRAETQYPNKQKYRLDLARPARKGNARNERGGDYNSTRNTRQQDARQAPTGNALKNANQALRPPAAGSKALPPEGLTSGAREYDKPEYDKRTQRDLTAEDKPEYDKRKRDLIAESVRIKHAEQEAEKKRFLAEREAAKKQIAGAKVGENPLGAEERRIINEKLVRMNRLIQVTPWYCSGLASREKQKEDAADEIQKLISDLHGLIKNPLGAEERRIINEKLVRMNHLIQVTPWYCSGLASREKQKEDAADEIQKLTSDIYGLIN